MSELTKAYTYNTGFHKNETRVYIDSKKLNETLMNESCNIKYDFENNQIILTPGHEKKCTKKKNGNIVVDILNKSVSKIFEPQEEITVLISNDSIIIKKSYENISQSRAKEYDNCNNPFAIEVFAGGGTLVKSFYDAGIETKLAIELEDKYIENLESNFPKLKTYCSDLAKIDTSILPRAPIVVGGLPCEGYSPSQLTGKGKKEEHPTGSLGFYFLKIIDSIRPSMVVIEEVPNFKNSAMAAMAKYVLKNMGYYISEKLLSGTDYGSLTKRTRYCMVASMKETFEFKEYSMASERTIESILEVPLEKREWVTKETDASIATFIRRESEHIKKGNGFRIAKVYASDTCGVETITKDHYKRRMTDPVLVNENNPDEYSWFTPRELARINGIPEDFSLTGVKGNDGQIIGQGVCYDVFNQLGKDILEHFRK